ncbi:cupin domain-containing protein [Diaphorobacter ruginosibacter]|jgi:quercetin dioxygenase-like cupin family protein|uniref:Cupin domain-containing protein n=1 Tax=Diaphorobacter ruginosibacter TaxID=1715720 RepID=A0A7G9RQ80_9BURK|nr:cupin domain-containing protein [Diaphorobacter ruginosibacter]MDR2333356.1 cupin domain-containing protein [Burkholderiaceae bacterium]QNN57755.1 cupin domain-containing protein [Diaphorobacter ruginosibacter]
MSRPRFLVRESDIEGYSPANHHGTVNRRLISAANVGARHMEVVLGTLDKGGGALPHAHPGMEQACYLLEGTAEVEVEGECFGMEPGDTCFFPEDSMHVFRVTSDTPVRLLVIYSPPYAENPARVRRQQP